MLKMFRKIFLTPRVTFDKKAFHSEDIELIGKKIEAKVKKLFHGSLSIREVDAGSDNACEQELTALSNAYYDVERFGIHFVASPKHADMLMITGPVTRNMAKAVRRAYEATPDPKIVVAVGDDAISSGVFSDSYAIVGEAKKVVPVHYEIPGDPPSPLTILTHLLRILETKDVQGETVK